MLVKNHMKHDPITVKKDDSFRYALKLIRKEGVRHLPVLEERSWRHCYRPRLRVGGPPPRPWCTS
jgi:CBS domain-containing protein